MHVATVDGRLFLDVRGENAAPPLLYLHGGPGMGCHEFMTWQGDRLSQRLRLIGLDQRGVLRSDPLDEDDTLTEADLVADCEALREWLGIKRWAVLGHSFGGRYALRYALAHPDRISAVVFENPAWDLVEAERARLPVAARIFEELDDPVSAARCRSLAAGPLTDRWEAREVVSGLHEHGRYYELYVHQPDARAALERLLADDPFPTPWRERGDDHGRRLLEAPDLMDSMVPLLPDLTVPALLVKGRYDLATGPAQLDGFRELVPDGQIAVYERSGHFVQLEEPDRYAVMVQAFVRSHAG